MANNVHTALYSVQYKVHTIGIVLYIQLLF